MTSELFDQHSVKAENVIDVEPEGENLPAAPVAEVPAERVQHIADAAAVMFRVTKEELASVVIENCVGFSPNPGETLLIYYMCVTHKLDPVRKEIYFIRDRNNKILPYTSYDGWIRKAQESPRFGGGPFLTEINDDNGKLIGVTCEFRQKGEERTVSVTAWLDEWIANKNPNWMQRPRWMCSLRAISKCARVAFGFAGLYDEDEAMQMSAVERTPPEAHKDAPQQPTRQEMKAPESFFQTLDFQNLYRAWCSKHKRRVDDAAAKLDFLKWAQDDVLKTDAKMGDPASWNLDVVTLCRDALKEKK